MRDERAWSGADPPGVAYEYAPGRSGKHGERLLQGFRGTVQVDGYAGHNRLARPERPGGALTLAACWTMPGGAWRRCSTATARRSRRPDWDRIAQLYAIEKKIRGEPSATRQFVRWTETAPLVNAFGLWLAEQRSRVSPKSRLGEKLAYQRTQDASVPRPDGRRRSGRPGTGRRPAAERRPAWRSGRPSSANVHAAPRCDLRTRQRPRDYHALSLRLRRELPVAAPPGPMERRAS